MGGYVDDSSSGDSGEGDEHRLKHFVVWTMEIPIAEEKAEEVRKMLSLPEPPPGLDMRVYAMSIFTSGGMLGVPIVFKLDLVERFELKPKFGEKEGDDEEEGLKP